MQVILSNFKQLQLHTLNVKTAWDIDKSKGRWFHNLTTLEVLYCCRLKTVMSSSMATSLVHLKIMRIDYCDAVEKVITDESGERRLGKILFPNVKTLELKWLKKIKWFYTGDYIECPSLVYLGINKWQ